MSCFEDLSGEILMAIFEYMNVEDVWTIFFNMNSRINSLVFDSRLRLTADVSKIDKNNFDQFCSSLINTNFSNIFTLILSNNYNRYPQIRSFLSQTNFTVFQSLHALTLIDINYDELMEVTIQIKDLPFLDYFHINTHEIFRDKELNNVTYALLNQSNVRVLIVCLHEKIQWAQYQSISSCNAEVLFLDFINADHLFTLLPHCPRLRSLSLVLDSRSNQTTEDKLATLQISNPFAQITYLRLCFRPFNVSILEQLFHFLPSVRRLSLETLVYNTDYMRAPFWSTLLQEELPLLERVRLIVRGYFVLKTSTNIQEMKIDEASVVDSYRYDRYWLDRAYKRIFQCHVNYLTAVLQIR